MDLHGEIELWLWEHTDDDGKRRVTRYRLTEEDARARLRDPVKVEASREVRRPLGSTSAWLKSPGPSTPEST
ncbi:MAG TPA: hypothetical protein VM489_16555 [Burkholderiales bacterium]|nr:hypothetical protein [Burkholderiales bacterium]